MKEKSKQLLQAIADADGQAIQQFIDPLSDDQARATFDYLASLNYFSRDMPTTNNKEFKAREGYDKLVDDYGAMAMMACVRNKADFDHAVKTCEFAIGRALSIEADRAVSFIEKYLADYFPTYLKNALKTRIVSYFSTLWEYYKQGWIAFDEATFVRNLLEIEWYVGDPDTTRETDYLLQNSEAIEKVLLALPRVETKVLDLAKFTLREGYQCTRGTAYWTDVIEILLEKGYVFPASFVDDLYASLLSHWKKAHLEWHCRLITLLSPTNDQILRNQHTLFAMLPLGVPSICKFVMETLQTVAHDPLFDSGAFAENFTLLFTAEKQAKTLLAGLKIVHSVQCTVNNAPLLTAEQLAVLLMQPDAKLQEEAAKLLVERREQRGESREELQAVITPYEAYLKSKTKTILDEILESKE